MNMIFRLALRNIIKYRRRTLTVFISILFSIIIFTFMQGFLKGFSDLVTSSIFNNLGHVIIQHEEYEKKAELMSLSYMVQEYDTVKNELEKLDGIKSINGEVRFGGILSTGDENMEMLGRGIDISGAGTAYKYFSDAIVNGSMLSGSNEICISTQTADALGLSKGESVLVLSTNSYGVFNVRELTVTGLFDTGKEEENENIFIVSFSDSWKLLGIDNMVSSIELKLEDYTQSIPFSEKLNSEILNSDALKGLHLKSYAWEDLYPEMVQMVSMGNTVIVMMFFLVVIVVGSGIINSILMSVYERFRDFGTMRAIGFRKKQLFSLIITESLLVGLVACIIGLLIGGIIVFILSKTGINLGSGMSQFSVIDNIMYPELTLQSIIVCFIVGFSITFFGSFMPALSASKLKIIDVMRHN